MTFTFSAAASSGISSRAEMPSSSPQTDIREAAGKNEVCYILYVTHYLVVNQQQLGHSCSYEPWLMFSCFPSLAHCYDDCTEETDKLY